MVLLCRFVDACYPINATPRDIVGILNHLEPNYKPRKKWQYGNAFYELAAHIIEEISGDTFPGFVTAKILHPLGMRSSYFGSPPDQSKLATPWLSSPGCPPQKFGFCFQNTPSNWIGHAAGGLLCTASDLSK